MKGFLRECCAMKDQISKLSVVLTLIGSLTGVPLIVLCLIVTMSRHSQALTQLSQKQDARDLLSMRFRVSWLADYSTKSLILPWRYQQKLSWNLVNLWFRLKYKKGLNVFKTSLFGSWIWSGLSRPKVVLEKKVCHSKVKAKDQYGYPSTPAIFSRSLTTI